MNNIEKLIRKYKKGGVNLELTVKNLDQVKAEEERLTPAELELKRRLQELKKK